MARKGRVDYPGALHHCISRGNERKAIFRDDEDRRDFLERLGRLIREGEGACYAWALMPNHFHLLLETGKMPLSRLMQDLLTGHAVFINTKYKRSGHLFQSRFHSTLCQWENYLKKLVCYIHLNPVKAGLVAGLAGLRKYKWSGHARLLGDKQPSWQDAAGVLRVFGIKPGEARRSYMERMEEDLENLKKQGTGKAAGIRRGGGEKDAARKNRWNEEAWDREQILGDEEFVAQALERGLLKMEKRRRLWKAGWTLDRVLEKAGKAVGLSGEELVGNSKERRSSRGRALACYWLVRDLGHRSVDVAKWLEITQSAVSHGVSKGKALAGNGRLS